jgi:hypothetical protein
MLPLLIAIDLNSLSATNAPSQRLPINVLFGIIDYRSVSVNKILKRFLKIKFFYLVKK